jgi:putative oxidoreductase
MDLGRLIARLVIGGLFVGHGTQKLFGWFGGPGLEQTEEMAASLDLEPAKANAVLVGATETGGGALLALGALTPAAAAGLIGTMITAIRKVHLSNGPWVTQGGYEYNLTLIAALLALVGAGPGRVSIDRRLGLERRGSGWVLAALGVGALASSAVVAAGARQASSGVVDVRDDGDARGAAEEDVAGDPVTTES